MSFIGSDNHSSLSILKSIPIYILTILILVMSMRAVDFVFFETVHVIFFLIPLYYWIVHRPALMPLWFVFLCGLIIDFSTDGLLGLHAFAFVVLSIILYRYRRILLSQPMMYHFVVFAMIAVGFEVLRWTLMSILTWQIWPILPSFIAIIINIVAYFPIALVLKGVHRIVSGYGRSSF
jgi:rod shape-determining protein MreD